MPLPVKLITIGLIPLLFALVISFNLYQERSRKSKLLTDFIDRIHQSSIITRLSDQLQEERNLSYELSLTGNSSSSLQSVRQKTDSLVLALRKFGNELSDFSQYTFLYQLPDIRNQVDSARYSPNHVVHFYSSTIFRLNTLNPAPIGASVYLPKIYPDLVSQKLLSEMLTYLGILGTNVHNVLYTRQYVTETLVGSYGPFQVYKSFEKEFLLKGSPIVVEEYYKYRNDSIIGAPINYLDTIFTQFRIEGTYTPASWASITKEYMSKIRGLQQRLLARVDHEVTEYYAQEKRRNEIALMLTLGILLLVILILIFTIYSINKSLFRLKTAAETISSGGSVQSVPLISNDVIGELARSILKIDTNNRNLAQAAQAIGTGNFNVPIPSRSVDDQLGNSLQQMRENLRQFTRELEESEARSWQIIHLLPACVYTCDTAGNLKTYNKAAISLWGGEPDMDHRKWNGAWKMYSREGRELSRDEFPMALVLNGKDVFLAEEMIIERPDGTRRYVLPHPQVIRDKQGNITGGINMMVDITERKLAEKQSAWLAAIVESTVDAIISKTLSGVVTSWNPGAERLFGYSSAEMIGQPITKIIPAERWNEEPKILSQIQRGERIEHFVTERIARNGKRLQISLSLSPIIDRWGQITGVSKIARDITEQVETARKIRENDERLQMAITSTQLGTWDFVPSTGDLIWSAECRKIFAVDATEEITLQFFLSIVHPDEREIVEQGIQKVMDPDGNGDYDASFRIVRRTDGSVRWVHSKGKVFFDKHGQAERFIGTIIDNTEQKEYQRALEESEQRTRLAIEAAEMGTFEWDLVTDRFKSSLRLNEIFGQHGKEVDHSILIESIHPEDRHIRDSAVEQANSKGALHYEVRVVLPDASLRWINVFGKIIYGEGKVPLRMYGTVKDVTDEKQMIKALSDNEERLKIAIQSAELGTWEIHYRDKTIMYSDRYLRLMGYEANEHPTHEELLKRIHPDDLALRNERVALALNTGTLGMELRIFTPRNQLRWIRIKGTVFYDKDGQPDRMLGTIMDITEQKSALHVLQESEERFKTIANTAPVMIWMSGEDKFSDFFNTSWLDFTGRSIEQERGDGWLASVYPEDVNFCREIYERSYAARRPFNIEYRLRRKDGVYRWISDNAVPRFDGNGEFIGFISACRDIEDEKRFNLRLQESELLFKTITNVSPVGLWMTDETGRNNFVNDTWIQWTGMALERQFANGWMRVVIAADQEYVSKKFQQAFNSRKPFHAEFRIKRKDGQVRWVLSEGSPYFDIEGNFAGYAGSVGDITERKEDEIRKNEFLAVASHELKTPLTSVKAYTQLLASTYQKTNDNFLKNALGKVENQVNKMTKLVGDFLNLSKIESDNFELDTEIFDMSKLAREVVSDIQMVAVNHRIRVLDGEVVKVNADSEKIAQVVTNFLNNAIKYSPEEKEITVYVSRENEKARLAVTDKGIGIKPEEHQKIFQRFYRSRFNQNISYSGFGIGLYISAEIIQRHEGSIGVESEEGKGSTFYFTLPLAD